MFGTIYGWCVAVSAVICQHSHTRRLGPGRPRSIDARQHRWIVRAAVAARKTSREEFRVYVAPAVSPRTIRNRRLTAELGSCVPLARLPLTPRHCKAWLLWCRERVDRRVERLFVVFRMRIGSVCMRVMDVHVYGVDLMRVILECIRPQHTFAVTFGVSPG